MNRWRGCCVVLVLAIAGCGPKVDYEDIEGVHRSDDLFFRYVDFPDTSVDEAFLALERLLRLRFAGARLAIDREAKTIETEPRPFRDAPNRVTVYGQVSAVATGARIELFAKIDRLRDDLRSAPDSPWTYVGGDAQLENQLFEELWDGLVVRKRIDGTPAPPAPAPASGSESGQDPN
jgi:hypothetical protein